VQYLALYSINVCIVLTDLWNAPGHYKCMMYDDDENNDNDDGNIF